MKNRVAIQGIAGCFHEQAAMNYFGKDIEVVECLTFRELCDALAGDKADAAIMAIENSIAGSILQNYALLEEFNFHIVGEHYLPIELHLVGLPGTQLSEVKNVSSHHMAIKQCDGFLSSLKGVSIVECDDTALAAKEVKETNRNHNAAIANSRSAELYGLDIIEAAINSHKLNYTRFVVLSKEKKQQTTSNKATLSFQLQHKPGALADVLCILKNYHLNLTHVQSLPIVGRPSEYSFYVDIQWRYRHYFAEAIEAIGLHATQLRILGEYQAGEIPLTFLNTHQFSLS